MGHVELHRQPESADATVYVVTEDGSFVGTAASFSSGSDREIVLWLADHARGRGVGSTALGVLLSHEAERPLYTRPPVGDAAAIALLERAGFGAIPDDPARYVLLPVLE